MAWEYKVINCASENYHDDLISMLNRQGADGWEIVHMEPNTDKISLLSQFNNQVVRDGLVPMLIDTVKWLKAKYMIERDAKTFGGYNPKLTWVFLKRPKKED